MVPHLLVINWFYNLYLYSDMVLIFVGIKSRWTGDNLDSWEICSGLFLLQFTIYKTDCDCAKFELCFLHQCNKYEYEYEYEYERLILFLSSKSLNLPHLKRSHLTIDDEVMLF